jgi:hypothetical protein
VSSAANKSNLNERNSMQSKETLAERARAVSNKLQRAQTALRTTREAGADESQILWAACDVAAAIGLADTVIHEAMFSPDNQPSLHSEALEQIAAGKSLTWRTE